MITRVWVALFLPCVMSILGVICINASVFAGEVWFYDWRPAPTKTEVAPTPAPVDDERHWIVTEFDTDPYPGQLPELARTRDYQRASILFKRPPAPAIAADYARLTQTWKTLGVQGQFKFIGVLPTESEAALLRPACELGVRITFLTNQLPSPYEAANLQTLKTCVDVVFALSRYPRYDDTSALREIQGLKISFVNNYYPSYQHMDVLNILETPVSLQITDSVPTAEQIGYLNGVKLLLTQAFDLNVVPTPEQYALLSSLKRTPTRRLWLRWSFGPPTREDVDAWVKLGPDRLQVSLDVFSASGLKEIASELPGEVLVETFQLSAVDGLMGLALKPARN